MNASAKHIEPSPPPLPAATVLAPAADVMTRDRGRVLIGGAPLRIVRLSDAGATAVRRWFAGEPVGPGERHQVLARRLLHTGIANPIRTTGAADHLGLTVVIPVKDDSEGLVSTLESLGLDGAGSQRVHRVVVVDDGSTRPVDIDQPGVTVLRNERPVGPGPARQRGLGLATTPLVAFVDAGVRLSPVTLEQLSDHLADQEVVAAAPRTLSAGGDDAIGRYERRRSALDLGPNPSPVGAGRPVPYVPTACLVARVESLEHVGGFDPDLRYGEDVDLVWRLGRVGQIRYDPSISVTHPARRSVAAMARQRWSYGTSAAPLAARHPDAVTPLMISPWSLLVFALSALGHPVAAATTIVGTGLSLRPKIEPLPDAAADAVMLAARGHWFGSRATLTAVARTWWPLAMTAMVAFAGPRRRLGWLLAAGFGRRLLDGPRNPKAAALDLVVGIVDDVAYGAGVWDGVVRHRSTAALRPVLTGWPTRADRSRPVEPAG